MSTAADLINKVRRRLQPTQREMAVYLGAPYTAGALTMQLTDPTDGSSLNAVSPGCELAIDLELFYVESFANGVATVIPGDLGSTSANHANGARVWVNPRYSDFDILSGLNDDLDDLSTPDNGLYQVKSIEITHTPPHIGYDLVGVTTILEILSVRYRVPSSPATLEWIPIPKREYELTPSSDTGDFASGYALSIYEGGFPGQPIRVTYKAPFAHFATYNDDSVTVCGLPATAADLPYLGAAIALTSPREIKRNQTEAQPDSRKANEVPPGAVMNSVAGLEKIRSRRIKGENERLYQLYGHQRTRA